MPRPTNIVREYEFALSGLPRPRKFRVVVTRSGEAFLQPYDHQLGSYEYGRRKEEWGGGSADRIAAAWLDGLMTDKPRFPSSEPNPCAEIVLPNHMLPRRSTR